MVCHDGGDERRLQVITLAEAERRYMQYGSVLTSRTVIEIAYGDSDPKYSIDRTKYFDLSRFIQHSVSLGGPFCPLFKGKARVLAIGKMCLL